MVTEYTEPQTSQVASFPSPLDHVLTIECLFAKFDQRRL